MNSSNNIDDNIDDVKKMNNRIIKRIFPLVIALLFVFLLLWRGVEETTSILRKENMKDRIYDTQVRSSSTPSSASSSSTPASDSTEVPLLLPQTEEDEGIAALRREDDANTRPSASKDDAVPGAASSKSFEKSTSTTADTDTFTYTASSIGDDRPSVEGDKTGSVSLPENSSAAAASKPGDPTLEGGASVDDDASVVSKSFIASGKTESAALSFIGGNNISHSIPTTTVAALNGTISCEVSAQLANHLGYLSYCLALSARLKHAHGLNTDLFVVQRESTSKQQKRVRGEIQNCFPNLRRYYDPYMDRNHFSPFKAKLNAMFPEGKHPFFDVQRKEDPAVVENTLSLFKNTFANMTAANIANNSADDNLETASSRNSVSISMPFLPVRKMVTIDFYLDKFHDQNRQNFQFDLANTDCCKLKPDPDESVFHFRNFLKEVGSRGSAKKGLKEIGPEQAARDLLGHLKPGDKVAIVNAFGREYVQPYVDAFEGRNLTVRVIEGQTGIEDFCFLMSTQKEMFGIAYSTFFVWAGVLSNSSRVVAYSMDTKGAANRYGIAHLTWNFSHPDLRRKMETPLLKHDESTKQG